MLPRYQDTFFFFFFFFFFFLRVTCCYPYSKAISNHLAQIRRSMWMVHPNRGFHKQDGDQSIPSLRGVKQWSWIYLGRFTLLCLVISANKLFRLLVLQINQYPIRTMRGHNQEHDYETENIASLGKNKKYQANSGNLQTKQGLERAVASSLISWIDTPYFTWNQINHHYKLYINFAWSSISSSMVQLNLYFASVVTECRFPLFIVLIGVGSFIKSAP